MSNEAIIITCLTKSWGGMEMVAAEMAMTLKNHGVNVIFVGYKGSVLAQRLMFLRIPFLALSSNPIFKFFQVLKFLWTQPIQLILAHRLGDVNLFWFSRLKRNHPRIIGFSHTFVSINKKDLWHWISYRSMEKVVALSPLHAQNLLEYLPIHENQIEIIPNGVDIDKFNPNYNKDLALANLENKNEFSHFPNQNLRAKLGIPPKTFLIGIVSRIDPAKGHWEAVKAIEILASVDVDVHLVIVGQNTLNEQDLKADLEQWLQKRDLRSFVTFMDHTEDVVSLILQFDVVIQPSKAETFGRSIIEAMSCAKPVVSTRAGGVPDIIKDGVNGFLVPSGSFEELARVIEMLSKNPEICTQVGLKARETVIEKYRAEKVQESFLHLLEI